MNLKELEQFRLADAIKIHSRLNPSLFDSSAKMHPEVRKALLAIADDFMDHLGIPDLDVKDITVSGSNAAYTYTPHSDIDLHLIVDVDALGNSEVWRELFTSKKLVYNRDHDIKVRGYDVELYVQDSKQPHTSLGEYSVSRDKWNRYPTKTKFSVSERSARDKFTKLVQLAELALRSSDIELVSDLLDTIAKYRKAGLSSGGEFGPENLAFKALRSRGILDQLHSHRRDLHSRKLSIEGMYGEDYDPNGPPPGPEFKPTMPSGTVRVDVSDVYDWYKLGQHISNLGGLGKHDFGKGPPSTILSFGDEDIEHEYIKDLEKTGLSTTDIDPVDPKQPKGMKRQKVDPTFNVSEASGYIPSEKEKNDPRFKTALTVDVKPDSIKRNAIALGLGIIKRTGVPPTLKASGKIN